MDRLDHFLEKYNGQEQFLYLAVCEKFNVEPKVKVQITKKVVQAPVIPGDRHQLRQLCVEMAVASAADFFVAFGDGLAQGMASMPSLLVLQLRLHTAGWPLESNAFSFRTPRTPWAFEPGAAGAGARRWVQGQHQLPAELCSCEWR
ncbi:unnamed protein product [Prorocentrum cordatum]|uniref:Uncharacterized protein n=1 Tax=Prorocentrum cordatum TaxID=2364126 RepID=A0ABN9YFI6_9DINO|nr:unnamed protein product [Polarella glacialis]